MNLHMNDQVAKSRGSVWRLNERVNVWTSHSDDERHLSSRDVVVDRGCFCCFSLVIHFFGVPDFPAIWKPKGLSRAFIKGLYQRLPLDANVPIESRCSLSKLRWYDFQGFSVWLISRPCFMRLTSHRWIPSERPGRMRPVPLQLPVASVMEVMNWS